jgi:hypothetical protein
MAIDVQLDHVVEYCHSIELKNYALHDEKMHHHRHMCDIEIVVEIDI